MWKISSTEADLFLALEHYAIKKETKSKDVFPLAQELMSPSLHANMKIPIKIIYSKIKWMYTSLFKLFIII